MRYPIQGTSSPNNKIYTTMALDKIEKISGKAVCVPGDDIDTDRIIPARFMKCVTFDGLGEFLFHDVRFDDSGQKTDHPLNDPRHQEASIIVSGMNFGCGSSREHAPQSIYRAGYRAVIAGNFAEIFFGNSINLGMPCVSLAQDSLAELQQLVSSNPGMEIEIDILNRKILAEDHSYDLSLPDGARDSLLNGTYDPLDELLGNSHNIESTASSLHYV